LTQRLELSSYRSEILEAQRVTYLSIERFDRTSEGGAVRLHHQEDLAQALGLDWRNTDVKFQSPAWPADPRRATARRVGELLGSIPGGDAAVERWIQQLTYTVAIGDNDAHAKNVALMHLPTGTELAQIYDALPNLFQQGLVSWDLAFALDGVFDQRRISAERILTEVRSWGVISDRRAAAIVEGTLAALRVAISETVVPQGASRGVGERLQWNVDRLASGHEISEPKPRAHRG
jgi:serine/threonine-protein kinase HipA